MVIWYDILDTLHALWTRTCKWHMRMCAYERESERTLLEARVWALGGRVEWDD